MAQGVGIDVRETVTSDSAFGPDLIGQITDVIAGDTSQFRSLRDGVRELESRDDPTPALKVRLGVCYYLTGRNEAAEETLQRADGGALALFYLAKSCFAQGRYGPAFEAAAAAAKAGYDADACALVQADTLRNQGDAARGLAILDELSGAVEQTAEYLYQRAMTVAALGGSPHEVVALLERAVETDPNHVGALFGLAMENDRHGNDQIAIDLYERSVTQFPPHVGVLMDLGLLYEDRNNYRQALVCFNQVLDVQPDHPRARLYVKDAEASLDMYFDEDEQKRRDRLSQVLSIPVTDFELSVRSRNCLEKMDIRTLGDLTRITEQELLASKNFGETSLVEIKEMLTSKGLRLGELADERHDLEPAYEVEGISADEQAILGKPIADLKLSVRARKCMIRLGINSIGELVRRTGDELLECKNFGVTSLNEVREKLEVQALKLRGD